MCHHESSTLISIFRFKFELSQITWTNIPYWKLLKDTVTKNTTEVLDFEGAIWWDKFTISFNYDYEWGFQKIAGNIE